VDVNEVSIRPTCGSIAPAERTAELRATPTADLKDEVDRLLKKLE